MHRDDWLSRWLSEGVDHVQVVSGGTILYEVRNAMQMTKEEFGVELYEAIACCAGVQQLLRMIASSVSQGKDVSDLSARYKHEKDRAKGLASSEQINEADAARLAREYPWLLS